MAGFFLLRRGRTPKPVREPSPTPALRLVVFDLPLAIGDPPYLFPNPILCLSVDSGQCTPATVAGFFFDQISATIQNHQRAPGRKRRANGQSEMV